MLGPASRLSLLGDVPVAAHAATALVLVGCLVAVLRARARLGRRRARRAGEGLGADGGEVSRALQARGLARGDALRDMSPRERQFLLEHAAPALGPRAVLRTPATGPAIVRTRPTPTARTPASAPSLGAPPPKRVHCPACGAAFGGSVAAPVLAPCPRCGRRVSAHVEGARLVVTVEDDSGRPRRKS
jgi:hypothetical protein